MLRKFILSLGVVFSLLIIFLSATFFIVKSLKVKDLIECELEDILGINVTINKIEFSPFLAHVGARGIIIHNPAGFAEDELAMIDSIHLVFDPIEILTRKKPNIYLLELDLRRLNIIKNAQGKVNIKEVLPIQEEDVSKDAQTPFYFDVVILNIGEVKYTDYSGGRKQEHLYRINLKDAVFVGLKNEDAVVKMVVYKAIENTTIGKMIHLNILPVVSQLTDTMGAAWGTAKSGVKGAWGIITLPYNLLFSQH